MILRLIYMSLFCGASLGLYKNYDPPPHEKVALMARYIVHNVDWVSLATISTHPNIVGYPFVSLKSHSDGPEDNSTGIPFLYMTSIDVSGQDVQKDSRVTILATLAESNYCDQHDFDPQDPRCAKVIITGRLKKLKKSSPEYEFGQKALFSKHPAMMDWPTDHNFYVATVAIEQICVLDFYGGIKHVTPKEYFSANITDWINYYSDFQRISVVPIKENI